MGTVSAGVNESKTIIIGINCPFDKAYAFLSKPESWPQWASGLSKAIERVGDEWIAQSPQGEVRLRFTEPNDFGVLDHFVSPPDGDTLYVPMRIVANGNGCEVMLTLFRLPGWSDECFMADENWVNRDLTALKKLLET